ncbi:diacylglycerol kinase family protein [Aldersonia sp. NBC_00410]|uniref:diacylglycerol/lipid kinase family protein n=1 Tax=Aldersonia sp. NBC_00410 TaxID=2975954 RepID=UPI00224FFE86|nr:diacylglycerol kinase family protein [Aldersonia sp. NBC_00410]MCX5043633.1 diacylglycerol kinase family protein [Aldersonia sp. NBC_00410]
MVSTEQVASEVDPRARWLARGAVAAVLLAIVLLLIAGLFVAVALLLVCLAGAVLTIAALYEFLVNRATVRWIALAVAVLVPLGVLVAVIANGLLWVVLPVVALLGGGGWCARAALARDRRVPPSPEFPATPPERPVLLMNPNSGGGKVGRFDLVRRAEAMGARVVLLEGPGRVDVTALAERAVARGADLLGAAGGDGTQAAVAAVAAAHGLPFLVIAAGTRNHFALDLGLDRDDPVQALSALRDGVDLRVDLGNVGGHPFVNNASFGAYAEIVRNPAYRDDKMKTVLRQLPDVLDRRRGGALVARIDGRTIEHPQAVLVSNGTYRTDDLAGLGRRSRMDDGTLGVVTVSVRSAGEAVALFRRVRTRGLVRLHANEVSVESDAPEVAVGIDGEAVTLPTPVHCRIQPGALRVRVPRDRPGPRTLPPVWDWVRLRELAFGRGVSR